MLRFLIGFVLGLMASSSMRAPAARRRVAGRRTGNGTRPADLVQPDLGGVEGLGRNVSFVRAAVQGEFVIWVAATEEDSQTFYYRAHAAAESFIKCFDNGGPVPSESRADWDVIYSRPATLPACLAMASPGTAGTFYHLRRK